MTVEHFMTIWLWVVVAATICFIIIWLVNVCIDAAQKRNDGDQYTKEEHKYFRGIEDDILW